MKKVIVSVAALAFAGSVFAGPSALESMSFEENESKVFEITTGGADNRGYAHPDDANNVGDIAATIVPASGAVTYQSRVGENEPDILDELGK